MIKYKFGEISCKISFKDFLCITLNNVKWYKKDFDEFSTLYEFIEKNLNNITEILFDGYEYFLENGKLHNLYGPALIKYSESDELPLYTNISNWFYIDGKLVCDKIGNERGCKNLKDFQHEAIFHYEEITNKRTEKDINTGIYYRRKEGVDYIKHYINLKNRIKLDQRKKKLKILNDYE